MRVLRLPKWALIWIQGLYIKSRPTFPKAYVAGDMAEFWRERNWPEPKNWARPAHFTHKGHVDWTLQYKVPRSIWKAHFKIESPIWAL